MMEQTKPRFRVTVTDHDTGTTTTEEVVGTFLLGMTEETEEGFTGVNGSFEMSGEYIASLFDDVRRHIPEIREMEVANVLKDNVADALDKMREARGEFCDCEACTARRERREANR